VPAADSPIAVVGAGAVGITLATGLAEAGHRIVVCGGTPLHSITLTEDAGSRSHQVRWARTPEDVGAVQWIILATKIHQTPATASWLTGISTADTRVIIAQNGVDHHDRVPPQLRAGAAPALVYINAERVAPGSVALRRTGRELVLPDSDAGRDAATLFGESWVRTELDPDFQSAAWRKMLTNAIANPMTALTYRRMDVLREPAAAELATDLLREAVSVGRAEGADLPDELVVQTLSWLQGLPAGSTSSMLQDRLAGRTMEYAGLTGTIVRLAERHGIPTPANRAVLALLALSSPREQAGSSGS
jgi:2-dehydropantoate 2-reductase